MSMETNNSTAGFDTTDRFGGSGLHIAVAKASGKKPYLGNIDVVGGLVREFLKGVLDRVVEAGSGAITGAAAAAMDKQECLRLAGVLLGRDPAYETIGQWNTGGGMSSFMLDKLDHVYQAPANREARDLIVADVLARGVRFAYEAITAHKNDAEPDALQDDLVHLADDLTYFVLGLPSKFPSRMYL
jgi:hypothetical protein